MLNYKRILLFTSLPFFTLLLLNQLLGHLAVHDVTASIAGDVDACFAYADDTVYSSANAQALQQAVDVANEGALIKVAGSCNGVQVRTGVTQTIYISKSLTLQGGYTTTNWLSPDPLLYPTILDAQNNGRVVYITGPIQVTLDNLEIINGLATDGNGGGIYHNATLIEMGSGNYHTSHLTITNSTVADSTASGAFPNGAGGGIASAEGKLLVSNSIITGNGAHIGGGILIFLGHTLIDSSTIENNSATEGGGGIILGFGVLTMSNSTITRNDSLVDGGGIENDADSAVHLVNSTVSGNTAVRNGGGIDNFNNATATITNTTISHNSAGGQGGGIYNTSALTLSNSIIANSSSGGDCLLVGALASVTDNGFNLVEDGGCDLMIGGDPLLGSLADNGGSNWTHALLENSPALDAGNCANGTVLLDQRGIARPQGYECDIGAFEREIPTIFIPIVLKSEN